MGKKDFIVLSLYEVHMASAALMVNGEVVAAVHEERFSRIKMDAGFPYQSACFCLTEAGVNPEEVDIVALVNEQFDPNGVANILFKRPALYSIQDWIDENERYWKPKLIEKKPLGSYFTLMGGEKRIQPHYYNLEGLDMNNPPHEIAQTFNEIRIKAVEDLLGIPRKKVVFVPHYLCHHYHAYYSGTLRGKDVLIMHLEGDGGKYNAAVSVVSDKGLKVIGGSNQSDLGRLYQWLTLLLGMKPYHHEYKIMGLAPYATQCEVDKSLKVLEPIFTLDRKKLAIVYAQRPSDLYLYFRDRFTGHRFDGIAGALQHTLEKHLIDWCTYITNKIGCHRVCYGGGVAMNVKANMLLSRLDCVEEFFVPLSPGDETNVFGAGYFITEQHYLNNGSNPEKIPPLKNVYLGPGYHRQEIAKCIERNKVKEKGYFVLENIDTAKAAQLLSRGIIIGRFQGRSEFGQRALGNRSILADPSLANVVNKINHQIKYRDFWMPFCPTILDTCEHEFLDNAKNTCGKYMTICFPVKQEKVQQIRGGIHAADYTARPQILQRKANMEYYKLIEHFRQRKKIGAVINTSFNLHGEPIVGSPNDALHTFFESELDAVWIGDFIIARKVINFD